MYILYIFLLLLEVPSFLEQQLVGRNTLTHCYGLRSLSINSCFSLTREVWGISQNWFISDFYFAQYSWFLFLPDCREFITFLSLCLVRANNIQCLVFASGFQWCRYGPTSLRTCTGCRDQLQITSRTDNMSKNNKLN